MKSTIKPLKTIYSPKFVCGMVKRENINQLIEDAGFKREIELLRNLKK